TPRRHRSGRRGGVASARPCGSPGLFRGQERGADTDRVQAPGPARRAPRGGGSPPAAGRRRVAVRRHRPREHTRRVHGPAAKEAARAPERPGNHDCARRGVRDRMRRLVPRSIRNRLLLAVVLSVALALAATITAFNLFLGRQLSQEADAVVKSRARAQEAALQVQHGRLTETEAPEDTSVNPLVWIYAAGGRPLEAPRVAASLRHEARRLAK